MLEFEAEGVSIGIGDGLLYIFNYTYLPKDKKTKDENSEFEQIELSINDVKDNLQRKLKFYADTKQNSLNYVKKHIKILTAQLDMLDSEDFSGFVKDAVLSKKTSAHYGVKCACETYCANLKTKQDDFTDEECENIIDAYKLIIKQDAENLLLKHCQNAQNRIALGINANISANTLIAIESKLCALIINDNVLQNYHILYANSKGISCVSLCENFDALQANVRTMVDGESGLIAQNPNTETKTVFARKHLFLKRKESGGQHLKGVPASTISGSNIKLSAVATCVKDVKNAIINSTDNIGILYTDIIFKQLEPDMFDEDYLFNFYRDVFLLTHNKKVTILINPCEKDETYSINLENTGFKSNMFTVNLRALLRASAYGNFCILLNDVANEQTVCDFKKDLQLLRNQLIKEGKIINSNIEVGIMLTTYYSALIADILSYCTDFFYIDINKISSSILKTAPQNLNINGKARITNFAVLRSVTNLAHLINRACKKNVCICGLSASDASLVDFYVSIGATELCVLPNSIPIVKRAIRALTKEDCTMALKKYLTPN